MWSKYIEEYVIEIDKVIQEAGNKCYWWTLLDAVIIFYYKKEKMSIKLPLPRLAGYGFADRYIMQKHNEKEIERVRAIWKSFVEQFKTKIQSVDTGQQTVDEAFTDGILLENGEYGLKYKESWRL